MVKRALFAIAFVLMSVVAYAQEVIEPGEAVQLRWDYTEVGLVIRPVQFKLYTDTVGKTLTPADYDITTANGTRTYTTKAGVVPAWTVAQVGIAHSYSLTAFDSGGESALTANTISFIVKWNTAPPPPSGFKRYKVPTTLDFNPTTGEIRFYLKSVAR